MSTRPPKDIMDCVLFVITVTKDNSNGILYIKRIPNSNSFILLGNRDEATFFDNYVAADSWLEDQLKEYYNNGHFCFPPDILMKGCDLSVGLPKKLSGFCSISILPVVVQPIIIRKFKADILPKDNITDCTFVEITMTPEGFMKKYSVGLSGDWTTFTTDPSRLFWARNYDLPKEQELEMAKDFIKACPDDLSTSMDVAKDIVKKNR